MVEVLALIPARGGSKGIPRKNIKDLGDHPLIAYSIAAGLGSKLVTRTIVTTDDEEIARKAKEYGAEVPFLRPDTALAPLTWKISVNAASFSASPICRENGFSISGRWRIVWP